MNWRGLTFQGGVPKLKISRRQLDDNWRTELKNWRRLTFQGWVPKLKIFRRQLNFCGFALAFMGNFRSIVILVAIFQSIVGLPWIFLPTSGWPFLDLRTWLICLAFSHIEEEKGEEYIRIVFLLWFPRRSFFSKRLDF